jgi:hypothetical protein
MPNFNCDRWVFVRVGGWRLTRQQACGDWVPLLRRQRAGFQVALRLQLWEVEARVAACGNPTFFFFFLFGRV